MQKQFNTFNQEFTVAVLIPSLKAVKVDNMLSDNGYDYCNLGANKKMSSYTFTITAKGVKRFATLHKLLKNEEIL